MLLPAGADRPVFPLVAAPVMGALALLEAGFDETFRPDFVPLAMLAALITVGLLVAARWPVTGLVLVTLFFPIGVLAEVPGPGGAGLIAVLLACGWAGYAVAPPRSLVGTTVAVLVFVVTDFAWHGLSWDTIFFPAVFYPGRWAGTLVRRERERSAQLVEMAAALDAQREAATMAAVTEERTRIAREMHDAVAHSVSVMTLQIGGLRRQLADVLEQRPAERDVMLGLERLGRESVEELRSLVGILRESGSAPPVVATPSLSRAEDLVADVRAAGLPATLRVEGEPEELPRALDVSAYRILQEALTNVLRHAGEVPTEVVVRYAADAVDLTVCNGPPGAGHEASPTGNGGHGLINMQERTAVFGGRLTAEPANDGGFRLQAHLPTTRRWQ